MSTQLQGSPFVFFYTTRGFNRWQVHLVFIFSEAPQGRSSAWQRNASHVLNVPAPLDLGHGPPCTMAAARAWQAGAWNTRPCGGLATATLLQFGFRFRNKKKLPVSTLLQSPRSL